MHGFACVKDIVAANTGVVASGSRAGRFADWVLAPGTLRQAKSLIRKHRTNLDGAESLQFLLSRSQPVFTDMKGLQWTAAIDDDRSPAHKCRLVVAAAIVPSVFAPVRHFSKRRLTRDGETPNRSLKR
jgi:hypothetical protein